jgi:hypothetical protein
MQIDIQRHANGHLWSVLSWRTRLNEWETEEDWGGR